MITIELTKEELDLIGYALGKLPYEQSAKIIENLINQYHNYMAEQETEEDLSTNDEE